MSDQLISILVAAFIALLVLGLQWLFQHLKELKIQAGEALEEAIPDEWEWIAASAAKIAVRAAYQLFPPAKTTEMLDYALDYIYGELGKIGFKIEELDENKIRAILEAAVADFYIELGKPELAGY